MIVMANQDSRTVCALTTKDNPFNPIDDYDKWFAYDISHGYNSSQWVGRLAKTSDFLSEQDNMKEIEDAIDSIVEVDPNFYLKVKKEVSY